MQSTSFHKSQLNLAVLVKPKEQEQSIQRFSQLVLLPLLLKWTLKMNLWEGKDDVGSETSSSSVEKQLEASS